MRTNIDNLIGKALNAGFKFSIPDAYKAADYLRKEKAATAVLLPATDPDGVEFNFAICIEDGAGFYSQYYDLDDPRLA